MNKTTKPLQKQKYNHTIKIKGGSKSKSRINFFSNLKLNLTIFLNMHSDCPITRENKTNIFEPGAKELFSGHKGTLIVANAANLPGTEIYSTPLVPYLMGDVPFSKIRKQTRKIVNLAVRRGYMAQIQSHINELNALHKNINNYGLLQEIAENTKDNAHPLFIRAIELLFENKNQPSEFKKHIIETIITALTKYNQKIHRFLSNSPYKKIQNIYKQVYEGRLSKTETPPYGISIVYENNSDYKKAVNYFIQENPELNINNFEKFNEILFEDPNTQINLTLRHGNLAYNFMRFLLEKTGHTDAIRILNELSQDFDNVELRAKTDSGTIVRFLDIILNIANVNFINSSCMAFSQTQFDDAEEEEIHDMTMEQWLRSLSSSPE